MYFQSGIGASQQRLKLSDGRILQLESALATKSLAAGRTLDWSEVSLRYARQSVLLAQAELCGDLLPTAQPDRVIESLES